MTNIFLSHSERDNQIAENLRNQIEQMSAVKVYMFEHDQQPGANVADKIEKEIKNSRIAIVLLTGHSNSSNFVQQEIGFAKGANIPLVALIQSGIDKNKLGMLSGVEYIPYDPNNLDKSISDMQTYIHNHIAKQFQSQIQNTQLITGILIIAVIALCLYASYSGNLQG